jgi:hypothetical protein
LIGEKFRAAPGIAAPVDVAALALQPIEFTKRIAAAATIVNASLRMGSPCPVGVILGERPPIGLAPAQPAYHFQAVPEFGFSKRRLKNFHVRL